MQRMNAEGWTRNYPKELLDDRVIIKTTNPQKYGIRVSDYLM